MTINFGKYKGKTIQDVLIEHEDYSYLLWAYDKNLIKLTEKEIIVCKENLNFESLNSSIIMEYNHSDWGNRD